MSSYCSAVKRKGRGEEGRGGRGGEGNFFPLPRRCDGTVVVVVVVVFVVLCCRWQRIIDMKPEEECKKKEKKVKRSCSEGDFGASSFQCGGLISDVEVLIGSSKIGLPTPGWCRFEFFGGRIDFWFDRFFQKFCNPFFRMTKVFSSIFDITMAVGSLHRLEFFEFLILNLYGSATAALAMSPACDFFLRSSLPVRMRMSCGFPVCNSKRKSDIIQTP